MLYFNIEIIHNPPSELHYRYRFNVAPLNTVKRTGDRLKKMVASEAAN